MATNTGCFLSFYYFKNRLEVCTSQNCKQLSKFPLDSSNLSHKKLRHVNYLRYNFPMLTICIHKKKLVSQNAKR